MLWSKRLKKIFGFFWINIWTDSWLILFIYDVFSYIIGLDILNRLNVINNQISVKSVLQELMQAGTLLLVNASLNSAVIPLSNIIISKDTQTKIGLTTLGSVYKKLTSRDIPQVIINKIKLPDILLREGVDYISVLDSLQFKKPLELYGFSCCFKTIDKKLYKCYLLWGKYIKFNTCLDRFTSILDLPTLWLYKYPGAVLAAWSIHYNGCNKRDIIRLLDAVCYCPVATNTGTVTKILDKKVYVLLKMYEGIHPLVKLGQQVLLDMNLFSASSDSNDIARIISGDIPSYIKSIPVITLAGILYASNIDNIQVNDNILPLGGDYINLYKLLCGMRNLDTTIPFMNLPDKMNPMKYIIDSIWGKKCILLVVPNISIYDVNIAVNYISRYISKDSILYVYLYNKLRAVLLYPDISKYNDILQFYKILKNICTMKYNTDKITD